MHCRAHSVLQSNQIQWILGRLLITRNILGFINTWMQYSKINKAWQLSCAVWQAALWHTYKLTVYVAELAFLFFFSTPHSIAVLTDLIPGLLCDRGFVLCHWQDDTGKVKVSLEFMQPAVCLCLEKRRTHGPAVRNVCQRKLHYDCLLLPSEIDCLQHLPDPALSKAVQPPDKHFWWKILAASPVIFYSTENIKRQTRWQRYLLPLCDLYCCPKTIKNRESALSWTHTL